MLCLPPSSRRRWPCTIHKTAQTEPWPSPQHVRAWKLKPFWNPSMGWRGNGPRKQWIMLRGLGGKSGTLKVSVESVQRGQPRLSFSCMAGCVWPCGVRSVEHNKTTIVNACDFFSGAKDTKERYKISTSLKLDDPCPGVFLQIAGSKYIRHPYSLWKNIRLLASLSEPALGTSNVTDHQWQ